MAPFDESGRPCKSIIFTINSCKAIIFTPCSATSQSCNINVRTQILHEWERNKYRPIYKPPWTQTLFPRWLIKIWQRLRNRTQIWENHVATFWMNPRELKLQMMENRAARWPLVWHWCPEWQSHLDMVECYLLGLWRCTVLPAYTPKGIRISHFWYRLHGQYGKLTYAVLSWWDNFCWT